LEKVAGVQGMAVLGDMVREVLSRTPLSR